MKLAIMQPYFFPYIGYFQLIHAVDKFVFYDDVSFIKNGWINRNRILVEGEPHYFTVPLNGASPFRTIRETRIENAGRWKRKMLAVFEQSYARAPFASTGLELLRGALDLPAGSIADLARESVLAVMRAVGLQRVVVQSSGGYDNAHLKGEERVVDICRREGATTYINAPGGRGLYSAERFRQQSIELAFVEPRLDPYAQQRVSEFVPGLSVLDAVMNCGIDRVREMLSPRAIGTA